jgi:hypothetical protein
MKDRNIMKLKGLDDQLYLTVGKIAMSPEGRRYFDNYPVITTADHCWYVLEEDSRICAFVSVVPLKGVYAIRNLYIAPDCPHVTTFNNIMKQVMQGFKISEYDTASAYCKAEDAEYWQRLGFEITTNRGNWYTLHKTK